MKYYFHPTAKKELSEAVDFYEECQAGLGAEFAKELYSTIYRITHQYPKAWPCLSENTRRCLTKRFPYGIIYQIVDNEILIIAVMQLNRKPSYWKDRTS